MSGEEWKNMSQEMILGRLRERGYRITKQRKLIISTILENDCSCCKEIYYEALKHDPTIGMATVYRTISALQDMGILKRDFSRPALSNVWNCGKRCRIILEWGESVREEDSEALYQFIQSFLLERGYLKSGNFQATIVVEA